MVGSITEPVTGSAVAARMPRFARSQPGSIGIDMDLMVLDYATCDLRAAAMDIPAVLDARHKAWTVKPGIAAPGLEVATSALGGYGEAADQVEDIRFNVRCAAFAVGAAIAGGGTHPLQALAGPTAGFGMRVLIGMPDADEAVRIGAWLNQRAPLFIALAASSPYWHGADSGFCSARSNALGVFQANGSMPASLRGWQDVAQHVARLARHGLADGIEDVDWDVRPDPERGAVELRALDTPLHPAYAAALACYARELCLEVVERPGAWPRAGAHGVYQWNRLNAAKRGVLGDWIDPCTRKKHSIEHMVRNDLARLTARSSDPDFPDACVLIHELLHNGGQARWLTAHAAAGAGPRGLARLTRALFERARPAGWNMES